MTVLQPIRVDVWQAWRLGERESDPVAVSDAETLDEAVRKALSTLCWQPGDTLAVQHSHAGLRKHTLWQFKVSRSTKVGTWRDSANGGRRVFVGRLEPKLISQVAMAAAFAPVEPFDAFRDDAVGADRGLVEVRS